MIKCKGIVNTINGRYSNYKYAKRCIKEHITNIKISNTVMLIPASKEEDTYLLFERLVDRFEDELKEIVEDKELLLIFKNGGIAKVISSLYMEKLNKNDKSLSEELDSLKLFKGIV